MSVSSCVAKASRPSFLRTICYIMLYIYIYNYISIYVCMYIRVGYVFKNHAEAALLRAVSGDQRLEQ